MTLRSTQLISLVPPVETVSSVDLVWEILVAEARAVVERDPALDEAMLHNIFNHSSLGESLAHRLSRRLGNYEVGEERLRALFREAFDSDATILPSMSADLLAVRDRDPSTREILTPFLYFKGFLALQGHRLAHWLWSRERGHMARHLQSRAAEVLSIDIHPAARMGRGIMLDHGNGLVIGETSVVEDDVSILQDVTLGGTGKESGDRHPKIRRGALIGAGAKILGNIEIGVGSKVGAGSVVVTSVAAHTSVAGVPARPVGRPKSDLPGVSMEDTIGAPDYTI